MQICPSAPKVHLAFVCKHSGPCPCFCRLFWPKSDHPGLISISFMHLSAKSAAKFYQQPEQRADAKLHCKLVLVVMRHSGLSLACKISASANNFICCRSCNGSTKRERTYSKSVASRTNLHFHRRTLQMGKQYLHNSSILYCLML